MRLEGTRIRGAYRRGKYMWLNALCTRRRAFPEPGDSDDTLLPYALVIIWDERAAAREDSRIPR